VTAATGLDAAVAASEPVESRVVRRTRRELGERALGRWAKGIGRRREAADPDDSSTGADFPD
jgi:hypothetical protein